MLLVKMQKFIFLFGATVFRFCQKLLDSFVCIIPSANKKKETNKQKLLIIQPKNIGDFIIFTGILPCFREMYPSYSWEITLLLSDGHLNIAEFINSGVISAEPLFDNLITINQLSFIKNLLYRFRFQKKAKDLSFDLIINCMSKSRHIDQLIKIINSPQKLATDEALGRNENNGAKDLAKKTEYHQSIYTTIIESDKSWLSEIEKNANFINNLGFNGKVDGIPQWNIPANRIELTLNSFKIKGDYVVICPGAFADYRVWPAEKLAQVIDHIWAVYKINILICGSPTDLSISQKIQKHLKGAKVRCLCGQTDLIQLTTLISSAKLSLTMDSGPAHISIAVNTALVCVVGGGHYKRFFPYGDPQRFRTATKELDCFYCDWNCKFDKPFCVSDISVETVIKEVDFLLKNETYLTAV